MTRLGQIALAILVIDLLGPLAPAQQTTTNTAANSPVQTAANSAVQTTATPPSEGSIVTSELTPWNARDGHGWGLDGGVSFYFLKPYFSSNTAYSLNNNSAGVANQSTQTQSFNYSYASAPAYWLAWTDGNGLGVRARYFSLDQTADPLSAGNVGGANSSVFSPPSTITIGGAGVPSFTSPGILLQNGFGKDFLAFGSEIHVQTMDIEVTWDVRNGPWWLQVAAGARYLHMSQSYSATLTNSSAFGTELDTLNASHNFNGFGPTLALAAHYQLFNSNLSVFGSVRGSLLVGQSDSAASFSQTIANAGFLNQMSNPTSSGMLNTVIPMAEFELGLEYGLNIGRSRVYLRAAAVSQTYFDAGSAASTSGNLSLFGGQASLGFSF
jgi:Legionella pneumophila major outer membrane protein precursor